MRKIYIFILAVLFLLRLPNVEQSLWLDEGISAHVAKNNGFLEIIPNFSVYDFHPPLYYIIVKFFGEVLGYSDLSIRLPSLLFCLVATYFVYKMWGKWASILFLANPLVFYYSQEARMYMLTTALLMATWYGVENKKWWANIFASLALCSFYGSVFFLIALMIVYKKNIKNIFPGVAFALMILSPLLFEQVKNSRVQLIEVKNWSLVLGKNELKNFLLIPLKFFTGRVSFYPKFVYFLVGGLWSFCLFVMGFFKTNKRMFIIPIALAVVISFWAPMIQYFRFIYLVPVLIYGLSRYGVVIKSIVFAGSLVWCTFYVVDNNQWREDWKSLSRSLPSGSTLLMSKNFSEVVSFYRKDILLLGFEEHTTLPVVYATNYGTDIMGINYDQKMLETGYTKIDEKSFRGIRLDRWKKN